MINLQTSHLQLTINNDNSTWSLFTHLHTGSSLEDVQMGVYYRSGGGSNKALTPGWQLRPSKVETVSSIHGPLKQVELDSAIDRYGLRYSLVFALAEDSPLMLWKITVDNRGSRPAYIDRLEMLNAGFIFVSGAPTAASVLGVGRQVIGKARGSIRPHSEPGDLSFYSNGWQSWSYSGVYKAGDRFKHTRLGFLVAPPHYNPVTTKPNRRSLFTSDMFGILGDRIHRTAILAGFLSQKQHFGSLEALALPLTPALRMWANGDGARLDPDRRITTDWACVSFIHLDAPDPMHPYLEAVKLENQIDLSRSDVGSAGASSSSSTVDSSVPPIQKEPLEAESARPFKDHQIPVGWCSWYHFFQKVTQQDIQRNLEACKNLRASLPVDLIQIDDGYESEVGDWLSFSDRFPQGVAPLAREIKEAGFTAGLWLAPFIVHPRSRLKMLHPGWLLRNNLGLPVNAGFLWNTFTSALDLTDPEALEYVRSVVHTAVHEWGFKFLKLDFLFAGALAGRYKDRTKTRAQVLRMGLSTIREAAGKDTFLLGCGCPLGTAVGLVDGMRISEDVDVRWEPSYFNIKAFFRNEPTIPAARNSTHNTLARSALHKHWWINDPDCLLLRTGTEFTQAEVECQASLIAMSGGLLMFSDNLPDVPPERMLIARALLPLIGKRPYVLDWFDQHNPAHLQLDLEGQIGRWHLITLFNWGDRPKDLDFRLVDFYLDREKAYLARSFWDGRSYQVALKQGWANRALPGDLVFKDVPAHGVVLLAMRQLKADFAQYLGSSLHVSQGMEVAAWEAKQDGVNLRLERPGLSQGEVDLRLPTQPKAAWINEEPIIWQALEQNVYRFAVKFEKTAQIKIEN
jgi:alpha-galactosidase